MEINAAAVWLNSVFAGFDSGITVAVHKLYEAAGQSLTPIMEFISFLGNGGICLILASILLMLFAKTRRFGTAMLLGIIIGALFTNLFLKVVIARPRPYVDTDSVFYRLWLIMGQHTESDNSFPSGHTTAAFASMVPLFILGNKKFSWLALLFAFLMGVSRIYLVVHFPSDVLGGLIVGTVAGILSVLICRKFPDRFYNAKLLKRKRGGEQCSVSES